MSQQIVHGADDVKRTLRELPDKLRRRMLRTALAAGARVVRDAAKQAAPVLSRDTPTRTAGLVRDRIKVRTSKRDRKAGDVGVFVNVQPAAGTKTRGGVVVQASQRGAKSKSDPYYWQWLEFGRSTGMTRRRTAGGKRVSVRVGAIAPIRFLAAPGGAMLSTALPKIEASLGRQVQKLNQRRP
jgi:HK97 gp10 family phage protein